jgi:hypothetical protein
LVDFVVVQLLQQGLEGYSPTLDRTLVLRAVDSSHAVLHWEGGVNNNGRKLGGLASSNINFGLVSNDQSSGSSCLVLLACSC